MTAMLMLSSTAVVSMLSPYAAEAGLAAVALIFLGEETRQRGLEQITHKPLV